MKEQAREPRRAGRERTRIGRCRTRRQTAPILAAVAILVGSGCLPVPHVIAAPARESIPAASPAAPAKAEHGGAVAPGVEDLLPTPAERLEEQIRTARFGPSVVSVGHATLSSGPARRPSFPTLGLAAAVLLLAASIPVGYSLARRARRRRNANAIDRLLLRRPRREPAGRGAAVTDAAGDPRGAGDGTDAHALETRLDRLEESLLSVLDSLEALAGGHGPAAPAGDAASHPEGAGDPEEIGGVAVAPEPVGGSAGDPDPVGRALAVLGGSQIELDLGPDTLTDPGSVEGPAPIPGSPDDILDLDLLRSRRRVPPPDPEPGPAREPELPEPESVESQAVESEAAAFRAAEPVPSRAVPRREAGAAPALRTAADLAAARESVLEMASRGWDRNRICREVDLGEAEVDLVLKSLFHPDVEAGTRGADSRASGR